MKAVVIKSQRFGTGTLTWLVNRLVNSPILVGSPMFEPRCRRIESRYSRSSSSGRRQSCMVAYDICSGLIRTGSRPKLRCRRRDLGLLMQEGKLDSCMKEVLEVIRKNKMVLATGHVSKREVFAIAGEALRQHVGVIITHQWPDPLVLLLRLRKPKSWRRWEPYLES